MIKFFNKFFFSYIKKKLINYLDKNYLFVGWNLKTMTCPPWKNTLIENKILQIDYFNDLNEELKNNASKKTAKNKNNNVNVKSNEAPFRVYNFSTSKKKNLCFR